MLSDLNAHLWKDVTEAVHFLEMVLAVVASIMLQVLRDRKNDA